MRCLGERGQAMVEFVLISPLLFLLVVGVVQVALALNYWLDMQRIANQGARWAVVARYPLEDGTICRPDALCPAPDDQLPHVLRNQAISKGLDPAVSICFPSGSAQIGEPVRVRLETEFSLLPILRIRALDLRADAEMRIEQNPSGVYTETGAC